MKKLLFLLSFLLLNISIGFADDIDVTDQYIVNPGFDEDISFNADGTTTKTAADGSLLNYNTGGYYDGFSFSVKGWKSIYQTNGGTKPNGQFEAIVPYSLSTAIKVGKYTIATPLTKPSAFNVDTNTGMMFIRAGWSAKVGYQQVCVMPCAKYRIEYYIRNVGSTTSTATNLCSVKYHNQTVSDEASFSVADWTKHTVEFIPLDTVTITFGFQAQNVISGNNPLLYIDAIKLYKIGDASKADLLKSDIISLISTMQTRQEQCVDYEGIGGDLDDAIGTYGNSESTDEATLQANYNGLKTAYDKAVKAKSLVTVVDSLVNLTQTILNNTSYPGSATLQKYIATKTTTTSAGTSDDIINSVSEIQAAIKTYYLSQTATAESPADYTFFIQRPWFCKESRTPLSNSVTDVATAALTSNDKDATGWVDSSTASGRTSQVFYTVGRTCWQCWSTKFTGYFDINQSMTGLPNGTYGISADFVTNVGATNDQHVYASSSTGTANGYMTSAAEVSGWNNGAYSGTYPSDGVNVWETVTSSDKVLGTDGKLKIGAMSTHPTVDNSAAGDGRGGVFWVTNFKLKYYGPLSVTDLKNTLTTKLTAAQAQCDTMHFAADKKMYQDSITSCTGVAEDEATLNAALVKLNTAVTRATASETIYKTIMAKGMSIPTVTDSIATGSTAYGAAHDIVVLANTEVQTYLTSSEATYTAIDKKITRLKGYAMTYSPAYNAANDSLAKFTSASAKSVLSNVMAYQKADLVADTIKNTDIVNAYITQLSSVLPKCVAQNNYAINPNLKDFTGYIKNPNAASTAGWTVIKGTGDAETKTGQHYSSTTLPYFDSYNGTPGKLIFYAYQVIAGIPNGTYTMTAACRTSSATGAFLFASNGGTAKSDTTWQRIPLQTYTLVGGAADGSDSTYNVTDTRGKIWEDAAAACNLGTNTELQLIESTIHNNIGYGWEFVTLADYKVTDHKIVIGMTTDSLRTGEPFNGTWFSVVDFSLIQTQLGDQGSWTGPLTGISETVATKKNLIDGIYSLSGTKLNTNANLPKGVYIIIKDNKATKVLR